MSKVKLIPGLVALLRMARQRKEKTAAADAQKRADPVGEMAKRMHPEELKLKITRVADETPTARTYRLVSADSAPLPVFQPGQYISVKLDIGKSHVSRAYTICSAPYEAEGQHGYYEITVRNKPGGFVSPYISEAWREGTIVAATGPHGEFYVSPIRDSKEIVGIAGGAGITPFRSMLRQFAKDAPELSLTILYGCKDEKDVLFEKEIEEITTADPKRFRRVNTYEDTADGEGLCKGFIDADFIRKNIENPQDKTFFICGPAVMYSFLKKEFPKVGVLERKQLRYEVSGVPDDVRKTEGFEAAVGEKKFRAKVVMDGVTHEINALSTEPLLVSIEKAGLLLDSRCRSGECGICRSKLVSGDVFILPDNDGRREADRDIGYIHPCATYPLSDITMIIPPGKAAQT